MPFTVRDVWTDVVRVLGTCDQTENFRMVTSAVEVLANAGEFDHLLGFLDICVSPCDNTIVLPREVETVLAMTIGGKPAVARDQMFRFHLNGPGDCKQICGYSWVDGGEVPIFRPLPAPARLVAVVRHQEDAGSEMRVYGYDTQQMPLRSFENNEWRDGILIPTVYGYPVADMSQPLISRVTRVHKSQTTGPVTLQTTDFSSVQGATTGTLLGIYEPAETDPLFRKVKLSRCVEWVRVAYRKRLYSIASMDDWIPLVSKTSLVFMLQAMRWYETGDLMRGTAFEANARRYLTEAIWAKGAPTALPVQINDRPQDSSMGWMD